MIEQLGPYRVDRLLGRGGMGAVYAATHQETQQPAALKLLSAVIADDKRFRTRFMAEVETLKKLRHANIVELYGWGEQEGHLFYAMELVNGRSLQEEMQSGRQFHWQEVVSFGIDICAALKHAHDSGVIHRDIKPANLLLTKDNTIKLTDFGIAKLFGATNITAEGSVIGTADFMSPEQADGKLVTNRTDLYSLGAVFFTLLAGRTPFPRQSLPQVIHSVRYDSAPSVRQYSPNIPQELELIIQQLMKKEPTQRIPTALVLSHRLQAMKHALGGSTRVDSQTTEQPWNDGIEPAVTSADTFIHSDIGDEKTSLSDARVPPSDRPPQASSAHDLTIESKIQSPKQNTVVSERDSGTPRTTHFTSVAKERNTDWYRPDDVAVSRSDKWKLLLGIIALLAIGGFIVAAVIVQNSPDTLYAKIKTAAAENRTEDAETQIKEFLTRYPGDPRRAEVEELGRDVESGWLKARLALKNMRSGGTDLQPYERAFLQGMALRETDRQQALLQFQSILDDNPSAAAAAPTSEVGKYIAAAKHQIKRLQSVPHPQNP